MNFLRLREALGRASRAIQEQSDQPKEHDITAELAKAESDIRRSFSWETDKLDKVFNEFRSAMQDEVQNEFENVMMALDKKGVPLTEQLAERVLDLLFKAAQDSVVGYLDGLADEIKEEADRYKERPEVRVKYRSDDESPDWLDFKLKW